MGLLFVILFFIILFVVIKGKITTKAPKPNKEQYNNYEKLPYKKKKYLLSKAENNFYRVLEKAVDEDLYICPKVRLADIIYVSVKEDRQKYFNKIQSKHIDFLLCNKKYLVPVLVIELDDSSHNKKSRINRDEFVNKTLENAGLPILRVRASYSYSPSYIKEKIQEALKTCEENIS